MGLHTPSLTPPASNPNASGLLRRGTDAFATTLSGPLVQGGQIAGLTSVANLSVDTAVTLVVDPGNSKQETIIGWVEASNIVNCARGVEGADQNHDQGAVVMSYQTAIDHNSVIDFLLVEHDKDGHHTPKFLVGEIRQWPVAALPDAGWLVCNGASVLRSAYPDLFAILGSLYGSVDTTHFTLPDYRGRVVVGQDAGQTEFAALGDQGGEKTHLLTSGEMPSHTHTANVTDPGHHHSYSRPLSIADTDRGSGSSLWSIDNNENPNTGNSTTGITVANTNTGGGAAHNNLQPYMVANMIIRALP